MPEKDIKNRIAHYLIQHTPPGQEPFFSVKEEVLAGLAREWGRTLAQVMIECLDQGIWPERYRPQRGTFTTDDQARLLGSSVAVVGAGGLGGAVCLLLARNGVGRIIVCDGDGFDESNLNRQLLSRLDRLGVNKAVCAGDEIKAINPSIEVMTHQVWLTEENVDEILAPAQVVVDCLDNLPTRYLLEQAARKRGIPFVHGAVAGQEGYIMTVFPEDPGLMDLYGPEPAGKEVSAESWLGTPTVTPAMVAGLR